MRLITAALTFLMLSTIAAAVKADDAPKRSPELQVLDRFVGVWDIEVTTRPVGGKATTMKTVSHRTWSLRGQFVRHNDVPENPALPEHCLLMTYDPETKTYPAVGMNGSRRYQIAGTWNEKTQTMKYKATMPNGNKYESASRFITDAKQVSEAKVTNAQGELVKEITYKKNRRKAPKP